MSYNPLNPNGQDTMSDSQPVVIASDQTAVPVSGSVTANIGTVGTLATAAKQDTGNTSLATLAGAVAGTEVQVDVLTMPSVAVTNAALTELAAAINSDKVDVNIVSGASSGTEYTEDAAAAANPAGTALILVREDARAGSLTTTDGDNVAARGNNKGEMYVKTTDSDALLTTIDTDTGNIATSTGSIDTKTPALGQALAAASVPVVLTAAQITTLTPPAAIAGFATSAKQDTIIGHVDGIEALLTTIDADTSNLSVVGGGTEAAAIRVTIANNSTGVLSVDDNGGVLTVDGTVTAELGATDNAVLDAIAASVAAIDTDTTTLIGHVDGIEALIGTTNTNTGASTTALQIMDDWDNGASDGASVSGDVAHDTADAGEPIKVGGKAVSAEPAPVTANDRVNALFDLVGKQVVLPYANPENFVSGAITSAMTGTTSTSLVAAPASGLRNYITTIICSNAHATVGTDIVIQDGNGGTTLLTIPAAAVYGGAVVTLPTPLRQPTTATAIYCANVTTGASTKVSAVGWKGA